MVLVFILCAIVILITLFICLLFLSVLKIEFWNIAVGNIKNFPKDYKIKISLNLFGKIKWIGISINQEKLQQALERVKWNKFDIKKMEQDFRIEDLKQIKELHPAISYLNLKAKIGLEDAVITSYLVGVISIFISLLLPHLVQKYEKNKYHYEIVPLYFGKNVYEIEFDGIIEIKMVHIINIRYYFLKKRREKKYEQRASNRRSYGYSYE